MGLPDKAAEDTFKQSRTLLVVGNTEYDQLKLPPENSRYLSKVNSSSFSKSTETNINNSSRVSG